MISLARVVAVLLAGLVGACAFATSSGAAASRAASASERFTIRVVVSGAAGDPGYFYVGGPINVTVTGHAPAKTFEVCMTPAPIERASCRHGRVGTTVDSLGAPSKAGKTKLRVSFGQNKVYIKYLNVRKKA